jgi:RNA polymerase sigma-70 factor (ECF subfamily)
MLISVASGFGDRCTPPAATAVLMAAMPTTADPRVEATAVPLERSTVLPSFRAVYDEYFDFVWRCACRLGVPMDAIEDVVQETFMVVHARLGTLRSPEALRSWLYSVVRRTVSNYHRKRYAQSAREDHETDLDRNEGIMLPSPLDLAVLSDDVKLLWSLLAELEPSKREVLVLVALAEMAVPEVAEALGIPPGTAYSRLRAARFEFQEALARHVARQKKGGS